MRISAKCVALLIALFVVSEVLAGQAEERAKAECKKAALARIPKTKDYGGAIGLAKVRVSSIEFVNQIYTVPTKSYKPGYGDDRMMYGTAFTQDTSLDPRMSRTGSFNGAYSFECVFSSDGKKFSIRNFSSR